MIPALPFAIPWRLLSVIALAAILLLLGYRVAAWHTSYHELPEVQAQLDAELACEEGSACADRVAEQAVQQAIITADAVRKYEQELEDLRGRPIPSRVIRVCPKGAAGDVRDASGAGSAGRGPAAAGLLHGADEFDTRPLRELALEADEVSARCRTLLDRDRALAKPGP